MRDGEVALVGGRSAFACGRGEMKEMVIDRKGGLTHVPA